MLNKKTFLCVIPARKGSTRIKNKNTIIFLGKPLISWTIEAAKKSKYLDEIIISTNDPKIFKLCVKYNIKYVIRPEVMCDNVIMPDVAVKHAYLTTKRKFDFIVTLQPTSPLRDNIDIDRSIKDIINSKADSLISVFKSKSFIWEKKKKYYSPINYDYNYRPRSQEIDFYTENGAIQITKPKILLKPITD